MLAFEWFHYDARLVHASWFVFFDVILDLRSFFSQELEFCLQAPDVFEVLGAVHFQRCVL